MGAQAGLVGVLLGGMIGASSEGPGFKRFDRAASTQLVDIRELVRGRMTSALKASTFFQLVPANGDARFDLEILAYGVVPVNDRDLGAVINARATLVGRDGKTIWSKMDWGTSSTTAALDEFARNPRLWPQTASRG